MNEKPPFETRPTRPLPRVLPPRVMPAAELEEIERVEAHAREGRETMEICPMCSNGMVTVSEAQQFAAYREAVSPLPGPRDSEPPPSADAHRT